MKYHMLFGEFVEKYSRIGWEAFSKTFLDPFLEVYLKDPSFDPGEALRKTSPLDEPTLSPEERDGGWRNDIIASLMKSDRNDFPDVIMVGRAPQNDIVLPHPSISKFHAYFKVDLDTGDLAVHDGNSSFGTTLNGEKLARGEPGYVESGATLVFAQVGHAVLYSPRDFYDVMRLKLRAGKTRRL